MWARRLVTSNEGQRKCGMLLVLFLKCAAAQHLHTMCDLQGRRYQAFQACSRPNFSAIAVRGSSC